MTTDAVDLEIAAIKSVLDALTPLSEKARASVLDYVMKRLSLSMPELVGRPVGQPKTGTGSVNDVAIDAGSSQVHIKELKEKKKPRSANEMAALVAYYLSGVAPESERKKTVTQKDMETYFKIAEFPLPSQIRVTLQNAKAAGYFDAVGGGEYKLNAVGHNLVVHSMPRGNAVEIKKSAHKVREKRKVRP